MRKDKKIEENNIKGYLCNFGLQSENYQNSFLTC